MNLIIQRTIFFSNKEIIINPSSNFDILQGISKDITYGVYDGNTLTSDVIMVTPSGANVNNYTLTYSSGKVTVKNLLKSTTKLTLTFTSGTLTSKTVNITLRGIMQKRGVNYNDI